MTLQDTLTELATELGVPGTVCAVVHGDEVTIAVHGVTSIEHPLPVTEDTLFQFGSTGKTFTATAVMVLAERGDIDLDAPVRTYVPELRLRDESVAAAVTVRQLLNHTAGWFGDHMPDTGDGDDALERFVASMSELEQVSPLGSTVSYNNASLCLAGRVLEKVTGTTYEQALRDLVLTPLGLEHTFAFPKDVMTHRFVVGHVNDESGEQVVARPWNLPRAGAPAGGWTATIGDQVEWAKFHLCRSESDLLSVETRRLMQAPTTPTGGSAIGDAVGISWLIEDLGGVLQVGHGGTTLGQLSAFDMVPEQDFAVITMTNASPSGSVLYGKLRAWALEHHLGITSSEPELASVTGDELEQFAGLYEMSAATLSVTPVADRLVAVVTITDPSLQAAGEPAEQPAMNLALLAGDGDRYVVADGEGKGMKGYFARGADGTISTINFSGRDLTRVTTTA